jgi:putative peptidoglycan lipid II flippase
METDRAMSAQSGRSWYARIVRNLRPQHEHSAFAATVLLIGAQLLSRLFGALREAYIAWRFGAGNATDVYNAAFQIPDFLYYLVAGSATSITFVSLYSRYLSEKKDEEAQHVFSTVLTVMTAVLAVGIVLLEIFAAPIVHLVEPGFSAEKVAETVYLTRIMLPMQLFFYIGGVMSAVPLARKMFVVPAMTPIIYTAGIILGGVLLSSRMGVASLAVGAVAGAFAGPFLVNAISAMRLGMRYRLSFDIGNSGFREWVRMSIPLMLGVSLATADVWIMNYFASHSTGEIARLNYAKRFFMVPYGVLGMAVGVAGMTFFSRLFADGKMREFAQTINDAVYRSAAASFLLSAWLIAVATPAVDLYLRRGRFEFSDTRETAVYFAVFSLSLALWTSQALYARAFYAIRDTFMPMVTTTAVTAASIPVFWALYHAYGIVGLAVASDIGIVAQTSALALLLHRRGMVPLGDMRWAELAKALAVAIVAAALGVAVGRVVPMDGTRVADVKALAIISVTWAGAVAAGLWITGSKLPLAFSRRKTA